MSVFEGKYTELTTLRQTGSAGVQAAAAPVQTRRAASARARRPGRAPAGRALPTLLLCLSALLALAGCSRKGQSALGPLGESGALSTQAVQPAPSGATEGGQVGFFLDVSGSIAVRQLGPNGAPQPGAGAAASGGAASAAGAANATGAAPTEQGAPIPPRIGDPIYAPDSIQTGVASTCRIQFGEGVFVELTPQSRIEIPAFPKIAAGGTPPPPVVIVEDGIVLFSVGQQTSGNALFATTGSAVVATRGADFLVARPKARTEIAVGRGAVQVGLSRLSAGAPVTSVETIMRDGVGPNPIDVPAGYQVALPSAPSGGGGAAASTGAAAGAAASTTRTSGEPAPTPRPLSPAYRELLFRGDRSALPGEPLAEPQGAANPGASSGSGPAAPASRPAADSNRGGGAATAGADSTAAAGAAAGSSGGGALPAPAAAAGPGGATQAGPTPPADPAAPVNPTPPSVRAAD